MMWDESTIAAIEMAAERPTAALWGGFAPTFVCHPSLGGDRTCHPECVERHQHRACDFRGHSRSVGARRTASPRQPQHVGQQSPQYAVPRLAASNHSQTHKPALSGIAMCRRAAQSKSATARSGLTLAGAADGKPAIHRCVRYRTLCLTPSESRARCPLSLSKRAGQATLTREPQRVPKAVEPLGYVRPSHVACGSQVQASFLLQHILHSSVQHVGTGGPPASSRDLEPVASDVLSQIVVHSCCSAARRAVRQLWNVSKWYRPKDLSAVPTDSLTIWSQSRY